MVRSFVQLTAIGYVIKLIFDTDTIALVIALLAVMVAVRSVHRPLPGEEGAGRVLAAAGGPGASPAATTLGLVVALGVFDPTRATSSRSAGW